jgi:hypothetical protein
VTAGSIAWHGLELALLVTVVSAVVIAALHAMG